MKKQKRCKDVKWVIELSDGRRYTDVLFHPPNTAEGVRQWLNGGENDHETLARFISIGDHTVINTSHIVRVFMGTPKRRWNFQRPK